MNELLARHPLIPEIRRVVQRIALISHAPVQGYNFAPSEVGRGQRWRTSDRKAPIAHLGAHQSHSGDTSIPRGAIDKRGDFQVEYRQKSHVYFERRLNRCHNASDLQALLREAEDTLRDWMKTPSVAGVELERGSFKWKCAIADDNRPVEQLVQHYSVSRATAYRYRAKYRGVLRVSARAV